MPLLLRAMASNLRKVNREAATSSLGALDAETLGKLVPGPKA